MDHERPPAPSPGPGPDAAGPGRGARTQCRSMFSQTAEYALRAVVHLAGVAPAPATGEAIALATKVPSGYLSKIMRDLVVAGLVVSRRGPTGGFALARAGTAITVLEVVDAVDPIRRIERCPLGNPAHTKLCPLHARLDTAIEHVRVTLAATTLGELAGGGGTLGCEG